MANIPKIEFLFFLFSIIHISNSLIVIPFKINNIPKTKPKDYASTKFLYDYFNIDLYANINTGIPNKSILSILDTNYHLFQFGKNYLDRPSLQEVDNSDKKLHKDIYISSKSLSFKNISKLHYSDLELRQGTLCSETLMLYSDINLEKTIPFEEMQFLIDDDYQNDLHIHLGLNKPLTNDYQGPPNFFASLKKIGKLKDQSWTIKFLSKSDGIFALGAEPHTYQDSSKDKRYQRQYYFKTNSLSPNEYYNPISIEAKKIYVHDKSREEIIINEMKGCYLNYNYGFIIGTREYKDYISKFFFNELIKQNICSEDLINYINENEVEKKYYIISCNKEKLMKGKFYEKFPNLNIFVFDYNYNFELTKEDLFTEVNDKLYFMIIFDRKTFVHPELSFWHLGLPFLKKYEFVHDYEKQSVGFYIPYKGEDEQTDEQKNDDKNQVSNEEEIQKYEETIKNYKVFIVIGFIVFIFLIVVSFLIGKSIYQKRKGRANELEENFDYSENNKNQKNEENKIIN